MPKKIGVITFHRAINYGAILQAYASWKVLTDLGAEAEVIDYRNEKIEKAYKLSWGRKKGIRGYFKWLPSILPRIIKERRFRKFIQSEASLSEPCNKQTIDSVGSGFDAAITGSDQVFNPSLSEYDNSYFCSFASSSMECYSYAVSIGGYVFNEEKDEERIDMLNRFKGLSIREPGSAEVLNQFVKVPVRVDVDPTMLLESDVWKNLIPDKPINDKPYILIYSVHPVKRSFDIAKQIAKEKGYEVVFLHNRINVTAKKVEGISYLYDVSPYDFLRLIRDAKLLLTSSFHGTVFSILFNTDFYVETVTSGGFNNRAWDLISGLGLNDRIVERFACDIDFDYRNDFIDWEKVNSALAEKRLFSLQYMKEIVE